MSKLMAYDCNGSDIIDISISLISGLYKSGVKGVIISKNDELLQKIDTKLWTFSSEMFIPHSTDKDDMSPNLQQFYLTQNQSFYDQNFSSCIAIVEDDDFLIISNLAKEYETIYCIFSTLDSKDIYKANINKVKQAEKIFQKSNSSWIEV